MPANWVQRARESVMIADGGMGTELHLLGLPVDAIVERANLTHPELVSRVHIGYIEAGAELIETNTYGANAIRLGRAGLYDEMEAINSAGVRLAKEAARGRGDIVLAGAVGPLGVSLAPVGRLPLEEAVQAFAGQIGVLADEGVDLILLETFADLEEIMAAARTALSYGLPVVASMAFDADGYTTTGLPVRKAAEALLELPLAGIGANCATGPDGMLHVAGEMAACPLDERLLCLMPNAGLPRRIQGRTVFYTEPGYFADAGERLRGLGANIIGGCCGSGPAHIAALASRVKGRPPRDRRPPAVPVETKRPPVVDAPYPSPFLTKLARSFVCTVEMSPPKGSDPAPLLESARMLKRAGADAADITDGPLARVRMSSVALAHRLQEEAGLEALLHLTCRDRNLIGMQADLLGAAALGVRNILALTGDPPQVGDHPRATAVYDVDAAGLVNIMAGFNRGLDLAGNPLGRATGFAIGVAVNPLAQDFRAELDKLRRKIDAGADFCLTQPIFTPEAARPFLEAIASLGKPVVLGLWPLRSLRLAEYLHNEVPGILVPQEVLDVMRGMPPPDQARAGLEITLSTFRSLRPLCRGVCLMAGGNLETELAALRMIKEAVS